MSEDEQGGTDATGEEGATGGVDGTEVEAYERHTESVSASDAFEQLGHEIRMGIIEELADARRDNWFWLGKRFADLRKGVGVRDAGKFSYHLEKLQPQFVVKDADEYKLTYAGMQIAGAITAGTYTERSPGRQTELDVDCMVCGEALTARYIYEYCVVSCPNHGDMGGLTLPPGAAADRTLESLVDLVARESRRSVEKAKQGVCPHCWGEMDAAVPAPEVMPDPQTGEEIESWERALEARFADDESAEDLETDPAALMVQFDCDDCGMTLWWPVMLCLLDHPAVIGFCYEHGLDVRGTALPALPFMYFDAVSVESTDPLRVAVDLAFDDETLTAWVDDTATVVDHERSG
jgi:hypothetical protein